MGYNNDYYTNIIIVLYYCIQLGDALYYIHCRSWSVIAAEAPVAMFHVGHITIHTDSIICIKYLCIDVVVIRGWCVKRVGVHDWP